MCYGKIVYIVKMYIFKITIVVKASVKKNQ